MSESCRNCSAEIPDGETFCKQCTPHAPGDADRSAGAESVPDLPNRYEVIRLLGRGGMGRVFLCRDTNLDVEVAIKVLPPDVAADEHAVEEIRKEARLSAKLRECPGIIVLYGLDTHGDTNYLVMEYAPNGSLRDRLKAGELIPEKLCRKIGLEILRALAHAHRKKVLHRDIKPANVLFDRSGRARLADFGLAKVLADASTRKSLRLVAGTPSYIPPEVIEQQQADGRADLYSLGCMLYEMATGSLPFDGTIPEVLAAKLVAGDRGPPDPQKKQADLTRSFSNFVMKLMAADREDRFPDAETAFAALRDRTPLEDQPPETEDGVSPEAESKGRRRPLAIAIPVLVTLLIAGLLVAILGTGGEKPDLPGEPIADGTAGPPPEPLSPSSGEPEDADPPPAEPPEPPPPFVVPGIVVFTDPPGARVSVGGVERGVTAEDGLLLGDLISGVPFGITLDHPGCEPAEEGDVVWTEGERRELRVRLVRKSGTVLFRGGVSGAAVVARREGAAPRDLTLGPDGTYGPVEFAFGEYEVAVSKHGYHTRTLSVRVEVGVAGTVDVGLEEKDGGLTLDTDPSGAGVYSGETLLGTTPIEGLAVAAGRYRIRFDHPDCDLHSLPDEVEIRGERDVDLGTVVLPPLAILDLTGLRAGVTATIDGRQVSGRIEMRSGEVLVLLERVKHHPQPIEMVLRSGKATRPAVAVWELLPGRIDLVGQPDDVDALLDGRLLADITSPVTAGAGSHRLELFRPNYRPIRLAVDVEPEATVSFPEIEWYRRKYRPMVRDLAPPPDRDMTETALPEGVFLHERRIYWEMDDAEMVIVPAGDFEMGSDAGEEADRPAHRVQVSAFLMDRYEVTNEQFARFVKKTDYETYAETHGHSSTWRHRVNTKDRMPVVNLCYADAVAYATWAGKRLPTEAEFEWALRGGLPNRLYPWGDGPPSEVKVGNLAGKSYWRTHPNSDVFRDYDDRYEALAPAASFEPNSFGLFDLSGNLFEWVADWMGPYPSTLQKDPVGPKLGTQRIVRGGSWSSPPALLRCATRTAKKPDVCVADIGFRCVVSLPR